MPYTFTIQWIVLEQAYGSPDSASNLTQGWLLPGRTFNCRLICLSHFWHKRGIQNLNSILLCHWSGHTWSAISEARLDCKLNYHCSLTEIKFENESWKHMILILPHIHVNSRQFQIKFAGRSFPSDAAKIMALSERERDLTHAKIFWRIW